ncbi:uncharacterized protein LOC125448797 isoform X3 [Stegostoma tigrinum]|uniref:uncharacterized protein LOC125448797 isoform X3 n=1 Tax=Stegostoma tigrinum TaxID=3053191 RepID=UPI00202AF8BD|nr:uncharacterized protein LOC125448797 isoform X3 [Stegostoma tigrinum]
MDVKLFSVTGISLWLLLIQGSLVHSGVHQYPNWLEVEEGEEVALSCHFNPSGHPSHLVALQWDLPEGNRTNQGRKEAKLIKNLSSNGTNPGTNDSKMILRFTVCLIDGPVMELSCFLLLLCLVSLVMVAGLGDSIRMRWEFSRRDQRHNIRRHKGKLREARRGTCPVKVV